MSKKGKYDKKRKKVKKKHAETIEMTPEQFVKGVKDIIDMINRYWL